MFRHLLLFAVAAAATTLSIALSDAAGLSKWISQEEDTFFPPNNAVDKIKAVKDELKEEEGQPLTKGFSSLRTAAAELSAQGTGLVGSVIGFIKNYLVGHRMSTRSRMPRMVMRNQGFDDEEDILKIISSSAWGSLQSVIDSTDVTYREQLVLNHSFPINWNPCTISKLLLQTYNARRPLGITIAGASLSSRSANDCSRSNDILSGRYSNKLQQALNNQTTTGGGVKNHRVFQVNNMAQGGIDSVWYGFHMDQMVNVQVTDLLVWEFAVNDHHRPGKGWGDGANPIRHKQMLDFWFRSVWRVFAGAPPPILLLYTWDYGIGKVEEMKAQLDDRGLKSTLVDGSWSLIQNYRDHGWNIQVIDVGAGIDPIQFGRNPLLILDDIHHPGCLGVKLIADMIQHALHSNFASCSAIHGGGDDDDLKPALLLPQPPPPETSTKLGQLLVDRQTRISSFTPWTPNAGISSLNIGSDITSLKSLVQNIYPDRVSAARADRKLSYNIPICQGPTKLSLTFTLLEPNLKWLGLDLSDGGVNVTINSNTSLRAAANGMALSGLDWIYTWMNVSELVQQPSPNYTFSFCKVQNISDVFLHGLVAVVVPDES